MCLRGSVHPLWYFIRSPPYVHSVCSSIGIQSPASFDWTIDHACALGNEYSLAWDLRFKLIVARFCHGVDKAIDQQPLENCGTSQMPSVHGWIASWDTQLDAFEAEAQYHLSGMLVKREASLRFCQYI